MRATVVCLLATGLLELRPWKSSARVGKREYGPCVKGIRAFAGKRVSWCLIRVSFEVIVRVVFVNFDGALILILIYRVVLMLGTYSVQIRVSRYWIDLSMKNKVSV